MSEPDEGPHDALMALQARANALEEQLRNVEAEAAKRAREFELKAEATRAGIVDLDGLRLLDPAALGSTVSHDFNASELIMQLRRAKPWLFASVTTSSVQTAPPSNPSKTRMAMDMSVEEWRVARAALLRRR